MYYIPATIKKIKTYKHTYIVTYTSLARPIVEYGGLPGMACWYASIPTEGGGNHSKESSVYNPYALMNFQ